MKRKEEGFELIGVRLPNGLDRMYTYKVRRGAGLNIGDEVIADTPRGPVVGVVVMLDDGFKFITRKPAAL